MPPSPSASAANASKTPKWLFSMNFSKGIYCKSKKIMSLTVKNPEKQMIAFTDRPFRQSHYITLKDFAKLYTIGKDDFSSNPPNAVFTTEIDGVSVNLIIIMDQVRVNCNDLVIKFKFEESDIALIDTIQEEHLLTKNFGGGSLFIDTELSKILKQMRGSLENQVGDKIPPIKLAKILSEFILDL